MLELFLSHPKNVNVVRSVSFLFLFVNAVGSSLLEAVSRTDTSDDSTSLEDTMRAQMQSFVRARRFDEQRHAGMIAVCAHSCDATVCEFAAAHSTRHLAYAYFGSSMREPRTFVSGLFDEERQDGRAVTTTGAVLQL